MMQAVSRHRAYGELTSGPADLGVEKDEDSGRGKRVQPACPLVSSKYLEHLLQLVVRIFLEFNKHTGNANKQLWRPSRACPAHRWAIAAQT